jgi:DnaK suppressor protein
MSELKVVNDALNARLFEMENRVRKINTEICTPEDIDMTEQAVIDASDEPLEALSEAGLLEITELKSALGRIESGNYGTCTRCGEAIHVGRLEAIPTAAHCISCAEDSDVLHHRL